MPGWAAPCSHQPVVRLSGGRLSDNGDLNYLNLEFSEKKGNLYPKTHYFLIILLHLTSICVCGVTSVCSYA